MRRLIRDVSSVLIISGLLLLIDAGVTLVWQEPVTAVIGTIKQSQIDKRFLCYRSTPLSRIDRHALENLGSGDRKIALPRASGAAPGPVPVTPSGGS